MDDRVVGLQVKFIGNDKALKDAQDIGKAISDWSKELDMLSKQGTALRNVAKGINDVNKAIGNSSKPTTTNTNQNSRGQVKNQKELNDELKTTARLRRELREPGTDNKRQEELVRLIAERNAQQKQLNAEIRKQQFLFEETNAATGSYRQLNAELVRLRIVYKELSEEQRNSNQGFQIQQRVEELDKELKELDASMGQYQRNVGNYAKAWDGIGTVTARLTGILGTINSIEEVVSVNQEISDSFADVRKTTGLAADEIEALFDRLSDIDTRTSIGDLLGIAELGGRLGIAQDEIFGFVDAVDKVNVALGDTFTGGPEQIAETLGFIRLNFKELQGLNIGDDLLNIGNALNFLGSNTAASEDKIANFVNRLSGSAATLKITASEVFGLSTLLAELGINAERGASGATRALQEIAKNPLNFADVLGFDADEFADTAANDVVAAFEQVVKRVSQLDSQGTPAIQTLEALGLTGVGVSEVFGKLSGSIGLLQERIKQSSESLNDQQSILDEFAVKNNNLAAAIDKARNEVIKFVVDTDLQGYLTQGIEKVAEFISRLDDLKEFAKQNKTEFIALGAAIVSLRYGAAISQVGALSTAWKLFTGQTKLAAIATRLFNTVLKSNPIGLVITALGIAVALIARWQKENETVAKTLRDLSTTGKQLFESLANAYNDVSQAVTKFLDENKSVTTVLRFIGDVIQKYLVYQLKLLSTVIVGVSNVLVDFIDTAVLRFQNLNSRLSIVGDKFELFGKRARRAVVGIFSDTTELDKGIKELEDKIKASQERIANNQEEIDARLLKNRRQRGAGNNRGGAVDLSSRRSAATGEGNAPGNNQGPSPSDDDVLKSSINAKKIIDLKKQTNAELEKLGTDEAKKELKRRDEVLKAIQAREKASAKALQQIRDLQNAAIQNDFDRQIAQAQTQRDRDISGIDALATPQQIDTLTKEINLAFERQKTEIEKRRAEASKAAKDNIEKLSQELKALAVSNEVQATEADISQLDNLFKFDVQAATKALNDAKLLAAQQLGDGLINQTEYNDLVYQAEQNNANRLLQLQERKFAEEQRLRLERLQAITAELQLERDLRLQQIEAERQAAVSNLQGDLDSGSIGQGDFDNGVGVVNETANQQRLAAERKFLDDKAALVSEYASTAAATQRKIDEASITQQNETNAKKLENEKRTNDQLKAINSASLDFLKTFVSGTKDLLGQDEKNRKKYGAALKALALAEIAINLSRELSAIAVAAAANPTNAATFGIAGLTQYGVQSATAIARATFAAIKIAGQKFEFGGAFKNSTDDSGQGLPVGNGGQGPIVGRPHAMNGVKAFGGIHEYEGREFRLKNGNETYIINKRAGHSKQGKRQLAKLAKQGSSKVFSYNKKLMASHINQKYGGIPFNDGGGFVNTNISNPLPVPSVGVNSASNQSLVISELKDNTVLLTQYIDETNQRIDRLIVVNDAEATVDTAEELKEIRNQGSL